VQCVCCLDNPLKYIDQDGLEPQLAKGATIPFGASVINNVYIDDLTGQLFVDLFNALNAYSVKTENMKFSGAGDNKSVYVELYSPKKTKVVTIYKSPYKDTIDAYQYALEYNASNGTYSYNYQAMTSSLAYFKDNQTLVNTEYFKRLIACLNSETKSGPSIVDAVMSALNQIFAGRYSNDTTLLGTAGEIAVGFVPVAGSVQSGRDLVYDLQYWDWSLGHAGQTALDVIGIIPFVGGLKKIGKLENLSDASRTVAKATDVKRITNVTKQDSSIWKSFDNIRGKDIKTSGSGNNKKYYSWDHTHNDIEVFDSTGKHLGSMNPTSGEMYKPAVKGRIIKIN
jgi:hypothetical protein